MADRMRQALARPGRLGVFACVALALVIAGSASLRADDDPAPPAEALDLLVGFDFGGYAIDDPIPVTLGVQNVSEGDVRVNERLALACVSAPGELSLRVVGPAGDVLPLLLSERRDPRSDASATLAPGRALGTTLDLAALFDLTRPGPYAFQVVYENQQTEFAITRSTSPVWTGRIVSPVFRFVVGD